MKKSLRIFLACFLGIICGGLVLSKITGQFSFLRLVIGMIVGGPLGYLAYDFKAVIKAAPKAWNAVATWHPNFRNFGRSFLTGIALSLWFSSFLGMMSLMEGFKESKILFTVSLVVFLSVSLIIAISFLFRRDMSEVGKDVCETFWKWNIVFTCFYHLPIRLPKAIAWLKKEIVPIIPQIPGFLKRILLAPVQLMKILFRFVKTLIIRIHRDERLVCMFDVMLGIVIFYFWGNLILSAICGGLLAVLNWQIISVRILHLAPSKTNNA